MLFLPDHLPQGTEGILKAADGILGEDVQDGPAGIDLVIPARSSLTVTVDFDKISLGFVDLMG